MHSPDYFAPQTAEELLELFEQHSEESQLIAGGTDLIPRMRSNKTAPRLLLDLRRLGWDLVEEVKGGCLLGACLSITQIIHSERLRASFPALIQACKEIGGPTLRNRGTLGGNLANASPAADTAPPLLVFDGEIVALSISGVRNIPISSFFTGHGRTCLEKGEVIRGIFVPQVREKTASIFLKLGNRSAMAISVVSASVRISLDEVGGIKTARIALGSVAPLPLQIPDAEAVLMQGLNDDAIRTASEIVRETISPISDIRASAEYRRRASEVLVRRALNAAKSQLNPDLSNE